MPFEIKQKQLSSRVSEMQEKEKEYLFKSKNILEEKKINLEKLKELKAEISQKCIKIENYIRDLDNILSFLKYFYDQKFLIMNEIIYRNSIFLFLIY